jgi:hypothetical protein
MRTVAASSGVTWHDVGSKLSGVGPKRGNKQRSRGRPIDQEVSTIAMNLAPCRAQIAH